MAWTLEDLRRDMPVMRRKAYLNTATLGPSPQTVTVECVRAYERWQVEGAGWMDEYERRRDDMEDVRRRLGLLLGASASTLALAGNASQAINWVAQALPFEAGADVIVGSEEHPGNRYPWRALERMGRIRVVTWPMDRDDDALLGALSERIGPRTGLVAVSHVLWTSGRVLPIARIVRACRDAGVRCLVDGAQAVGQIAVDLGALDPDFYAFTGHKWLLGPVGTGGLYVRPEVFGSLGLLPAGEGSVDGADADRPDVAWRQTPRRWEVGTRNWAFFSGLARAVAILGELQMGNVFAAQRRLVGDFLQDLPRGVSAVEVPERAATVTLRLPGPPERVCAALYRHGKVVAYGVDGLGVRFSFGAYNTSGDIVRTHAAIEAVMRDG